MYQWFSLEAVHCRAQPVPGECLVISTSGDQIWHGKRVVIFG